MHHGSPHRAAPNLLRSIVRGHSHDVEAPIEGLQFRRGANPHPDAARRPVLNMDRDPHGNLALFTKGLERIEARDFHQPDHVRSRVHRRQLWMMTGQGMLQFNRLFGFTARADGNGKGHARTTRLLRHAAGLRCRRVLPKVSWLRLRPHPAPSSQLADSS